MAKAADQDIQAIREEFIHDRDEWSEIRKEADIDMRYVAGDPWDPDDREAREKLKRPVLSADEIGQYTNQVVNEVRSNKRGVKFLPVGNGANDKTAQFYADKMREIEYRSRAQVAYTVAFQNAVERGFGFVRVESSYLHPRATYQDLTIRAIPNPNLVTPDPYALMSDLSDQQHCWVREKYADNDYNRLYEKYKLDDKQKKAARTEAPDWMTDDGVFVGEYWCIKTRKRKLLIVSGQDQRADPQGVFEDEFNPQEHGQVLDTREVDEPQVKQILTNGLEILNEVEWPGKYIPIVGCMGKVIYVQDGGKDKRRILSMVRLARDPQMLYAYLVTTEAEMVSAIPKFPYFVYEGQLTDTELTNLTNSVSAPVPVVKIKPSIEGLPPGNGPLPFPQRNPYTADALGGVEMAKEAARRAIQAAMGQSPLPTAAQRRNDKSGVALKQIEEMGQKGAYHFMDHFMDMITQVGVIVEDLMSKVIDTPRDVPLRTANDKARSVRVNDPNDPESLQVKGDHQVTVSTGPSFESEREAASDFADTFVTSPIMEMVGPEKGPKLLAQAIKLKNLGPIGDEMAEIISPTPPEPGKMPTPEQLQQILMQAQGKMQEMEQGLQQAQKAMETDQAKQQATIQKAQIDAQADLQKTQMLQQASLQAKQLEMQSRERLAEIEMRAKLALQEQKATLDADKEMALQVMKNAATLAVAHIGANAKGAEIDAHAEEEAAALGMDAMQQNADRELDLVQADADDRQLAADRQHEADQLDRDRFLEEQLAAQPPTDPQEPSEGDPGYA